MLNFTPEHSTLDPRVIRSNWEAIERHVNDDHYVREFTPGKFVLAGAAVAFAVNNGWPVVEFTNASVLDTDIATVSFRKPSEWRTGKLRLGFWYTSDAAGASNFSIGTRIYGVRRGEALPGTLLYSAANAVPGPAAGGDLLYSGDFYTSTSFGSDDELFRVLFTRDGTDANGNDFHLVHVVVEHIQATRQSQ